MQAVRKKLLEKTVLAHQEAYDRGKPTIADAEFDDLVEQLRKVDPTSTVLDQLGASRTNRKTNHAVPMLSLRKAKTMGELMNWARDIGGVDFVVMPKFDGVSLSCIYERGKLVRAVTRGDGKTGDDVTHIAKFFVPSRQPEGCVNYEVRGEVIFSKETWEKVQQAFLDRNGGKPVNARNAAAGSLMRKTITKEARKLHFVPYDLIDHSHRAGHGSPLSRNLDARLTLVGDTESFVKVCGLEELDKTCTEMINIAMECGYETDGIVVRVRDFRYRKTLGATSHHPHWSIALKHDNQQPEKATVKKIHWQVSRSGTLTPVVEVDPIVLAGVTVTYATLHHAGMYIQSEIRKGSKVLMTRRGGVIPHIETVYAHPRNAMPEPYPKRCPCCKAPTKLEGDFLRCTEPGECPDVQRGKLVYWCAQTDLMGFGENVIYELYNEGIVQLPQELYTLDVDVMKQLFGANLGPKLVKEARDKSRLTPAQLFTGLGIEGIGKTQAEKLFEAIDFDELMHLYFNDADEEIVSKLPEGFGPVLTRNLLRGLAANRGIIQSLAEVLEIVKPQKSSVTVGPFVGKKVVFTGKLADMEREVAMQTVRDLGGATPSSVTKSIDYLVVGSLASDEQLHKRNKAADYNLKGAKISIISEERFAELLASAYALKEDHDEEAD